MTQDLPRHSQNRLKRVRASARRFLTLNSKISFHRFMMADMGPHAPITDAVFAAYLRCEMKALLLLDGSAPTDPEIQSWQQDIANSYKANASERLCTNVLENETCRGMPSLRVLRERAYRLIINPEISSPELKIQAHALERIPVSRNEADTTYRPVRFVPNEKLASSDKLLVALDALALSRLTGRMPPTARIIHGAGHRSTAVQLPKLVKEARSLVDMLRKQYASGTPPPLALNKHCPECPFRSRCRQIAIEKDDLSLLTTLSEKERKKLNRKGITTVAQFSCTYRPRRRSARNRATAIKHEPALKALAIQANRIHVVDTPTFAIKSGAVYLDVEGVPDREFYYLIGMRYRSGDEDLHLSFWADEPSDECDMWRSFVETLVPNSDVRLVHYGSYETQFLKRMKERYCDDLQDVELVDRLIATSINLLSLTYAHVYFPTYSNGLKDIAGYLGFRWTHANASGLHALMWRSEWEVSGDPTVKQTLITYNAEDCEAAQRVAEAIADICVERPAGASSEVSINVNALEHEYRGRFGPIQYAISDFKPINEAAYWDYQRQRVYVRSNKRLKRLSKGSVPRTVKRPSIIYVREDRPRLCTRCGSGTIYKHGRWAKIAYDLKFTPSGLKLQYAQFRYHRYRCKSCGNIFYNFSVERHGRGLRSYITYQIIDLRLSQGLVAQNLKDVFGLDLGHSTILALKTAVANEYASTYQKILQRIASGPIAHVDETKVTVDGKTGYVWAFTNLEEIIYIYSETRDATTINKALQGFQGILISDFYAVYDSVECIQQKCLIHLMRDINGDLLKHPFDKELQELASDFARLLRSVVATIDRFGLKTRYLRKHRRAARQFLCRISGSNPYSEVAASYRKRFEKHGDKLFTFLDHDGVPWNNNNAEHAIKAVVQLRNVIGGKNTAKGISAYLLLLSICETCKSKGIRFLDFLRSGVMDVDAFAACRGRTKPANRTPAASGTIEDERQGGGYLEAPHPVARDGLT
jgi:predicted RecB family nuclease